MSSIVFDESWAAEVVNGVKLEDNVRILRKAYTKLVKECENVGRCDDVTKNPTIRSILDEIVEKVKEIDDGPYSNEIKQELNGICHHTLRFKDLRQTKAKNLRHFKFAQGNLAKIANDLAAMRGADASTGQATIDEATPKATIDEATPKTKATVDATSDPKAAVDEDCEINDTTLTSDLDNVLKLVKETSLELDNTLKADTSIDTSKAAKEVAIVPISNKKMRWSVVKHSEPLVAKFRSGEIDANLRKKHGCRNKLRPNAGLRKELVDIYYGDVLSNSGFVFDESVSADTFVSNYMKLSWEFLEGTRKYSTLLSTYFIDTNGSSNLTIPAVHYLEIVENETATQRNTRFRKKYRANANMSSATDEDITDKSTADKKVAAQQRPSPKKKSSPKKSGSAKVKFRASSDLSLESNENTDPNSLSMATSAASRRSVAFTAKSPEIRFFELEAQDEESDIDLDPDELQAKMIALDISVSENAAMQNLESKETNKLAAKSYEASSKAVEEYNKNLKGMLSQTKQLGDLTSEMLKSKSPAAKKKRAIKLFQNSSKKVEDVIAASAKKARRPNNDPAPKSNDSPDTANPFLTPGIQKKLSYAHQQD